MAAMFPMLLSGMAGLPNLLGMGSLLNKSSQPCAKGKEKNCTKDSKEADNNKERTISPAEDKSKQTSSPPSTSMGAALQAGSLSINPLLLPNILYPGMLLTPSLNLHIPAVPQTSVFDVQNTNNKKNTDPVPVSDSAAVPPPSPPAAQTREEKAATQGGSQNENSTDEGSEKADPSSGSNSPSSSSSEDSDSSEED
ncbi:unnamed protein product [Ranitomeya imitator]|uniref:Uncharacterized protein n=2 Tax=Ranitomeya imitator TaxID=111125 RepID=A0ABN9LA99_9NEOB|nr:unnamed protein product [Ranitomeya imitator]